MQIGGVQLIAIGAVSWLRQPFATTLRGLWFVMRKIYSRAVFAKLISCKSASDCVHLIRDKMHSFDISNYRFIKIVANISCRYYVQKRDFRGWDLNKWTGCWYASAALIPTTGSTTSLILASGLLWRSLRDKRRKFQPPTEMKTTRQQSDWNVNVTNLTSRKEMAIAIPPMASTKLLSVGSSLV